MTAPRSHLPPRLLPLLYLALAHVALALAFAAVVWDPRGVAGFFYHARMLGIVHLVTLGWITGSILGALYLVAAIALRVTLPARWPDYTAFALLGIGVVGMVAHFWIQEYGGMAWSAGTAGCGILLTGARTLPYLRRSAADPAVRAHIFLAFANIAGAATMGVLLGVDKVHPILGGYVLDNVYAHAHLAAIGWATLMVIGTSYRLLPMVLPAAMPQGTRLWMTAVMIQSGVVGLFVSLLLRSRTIPVFAVLIVVGLTIYLTVLVGMVRNPRPRPPAIKVPDPAMLHAGAAMLSLAIAAGLGLWLSTAPASASTPAIAVAYGVFGLVGFLAQMVVAMKGRLLPLFAWYWAFANTDFKGSVESPHTMAWRPAQLVVVGLWWIGVPAIALALARGSAPWIRGSALMLLIATLLDTAQAVRIVRHAYRRTGARG